VLLAKPNDKFSDLPRHPCDVQSPQECVRCKKDDGDPLECDKVLSNTLHCSDVKLILRSSVILHGTSSAWTHLSTLFLTVNGSVPNVSTTLVHLSVSGGISQLSVKGRERNRPRTTYMRTIDPRAVRADYPDNLIGDRFTFFGHLCRPKEKETVTHSLVQWSETERQYSLRRMIVIS